MSIVDGRCCVDLDNDNKCDLDEKDSETEIEEKPVITIEPPVGIEQKIEIEPVIEENTTENEITGAVIEETINVESPVEEEKPDSEAYKFIELYESKNVGYQYIYNTKWYRLKNDKIKIELKILKKYSDIEINGKSYPTFYVDRIYLDRKTQQAKAYCEKDNKCIEENWIDLGLFVDYTEFKTKTPDEWLYEYGVQKPFLFEERKYYVKGRQTTRATYEIENGEVRVFFDPKIGLPIRIETQIGESTIDVLEFFELASGTVRDIDVIHRTQDEISPEDIFYSTRS